jgi:hypothetical protein
MKTRNRKAYQKQYCIDNAEKRNAYQKQYRINNLEKRIIYEKQYRIDNVVKAKFQEIKRKYGLSDKQYNEMLTQQVSGCTICGKTMVENARYLAVDHNHNTGKIRELLCDSCNNGLGRFQDNPLLLRKAADYLDKHNNIHIPAPKPTEVPKK